MLIAGTYTPVTLGVMRGGWGWTLLGVIWALAFAGITLKIFALGKIMKLSLVIYILKGWIVLIAIKPLLKSVTPTFMIWLASGGLCYTCGIAFTP